MIRTIALAAIAAVALSLPSAAATVFSTDFAGDTPVLNGTPAGFAVTGQVDIVGASNPYGIVTPGGTVIDLDGTPGPGELTSLSSYAFGAGDTVTLSFIVGGPQRGSGIDGFFARLIFGSVTAVNNFQFFGTLGNVNFGDTLLASTFSAFAPIEGDAAFASTGFSFTAVNAGSLAFTIGTGSNDNIGPLLAGVTLDVAPIPLPAAGPALLLALGLLIGLRRKRA